MSNTATMMMTPQSKTTGVSWESLRRQARSLEDDLDTKLSSLTQQVARINSGLVGDRLASSSPADFDANRENYVKLLAEVEQLLQRLNQVNDSMSTLVQPPNSASLHNSSSMAAPVGQLHTINRHREILRDHYQELRRIQTNYRNAVDRRALLGTSSNLIAKSVPSSASLSSTSASSDSTRLLLSEQDHYTRSNRSIDEQLSMAKLVKQSLANQRLQLRSTVKQLSGMASRLPMVGRLVTRVNWRTNKDAIILGLVIGSCVLFLLIYRFV